MSAGIFSISSPPSGSPPTVCPPKVNTTTPHMSTTTAARVIFSIRGRLAIIRSRSAIVRFPALMEVEARSRSLGPGRAIIIRSRVWP